MKQVLVIRKDLNMRKGKMVAQGSHASLVSYLKCDHEVRKKWMNEGQTKICVSVDSEEELQKIFAAASQAGLAASYIKDAGHTELEHGTATAVGIGPAENDVIDQITSHLKLL